MRLIDSHRLSGPNIYTSRPVAVARLELDGLTGQETSDCPGFAARLTGALPGLAGHHSRGAIVDRLYPPGAPSRIPIVSVTGTNGKTTTVRMISHILGQAGLRVGMATTDGVYCGGQLIHAADASGPRSAEMVLDDSMAEAAVLETARGGIVRRGLGYDRAADPVLLTYETLAPVRDLLDRLGATAWTGGPAQPLG